MYEETEKYSLFSSYKQTNSIEGSGSEEYGWMFTQEASRACFIHFRCFPLSRSSGGSSGSPEKPPLVGDQPGREQAPSAGAARTRISKNWLVGIKISWGLVCHPERDGRGFRLNLIMLL